MARHGCRHRTSATPDSRLTAAACTPGTARSAASTAEEQEEQVMPCTCSSCWQESTVPSTAGTEAGGGGSGGQEGAAGRGPRRPAGRPAGAASQHGVPRRRRALPPTATHLPPLTSPSLRQRSTAGCTQGRGRSPVASNPQPSTASTSACSSTLPPPPTACRTSAW